MPSSALTVTQLNRYIKSLLEGDRKLHDVLIRGEIHSFHRHFKTGHLFFSLKDGGSSLKVVMFRSAAAQLQFDPQDGMQVIVRGDIAVFERDGAYQLYAREIIPDGVGAQQMALEQLKQRLAAEGLFDAAHKKPLPAFPRHIALITSKSGAALQDILQVIGRRYDLCQLSLLPVTVQGEGAVPTIVRAVEYLSHRPDFDLAILARGGGSQQDLWLFNDERIARAIYNCPVPIISAIGHEIDFTVADLVADMRAPTPSAAAELAVPDLGDIRLQLEQLGRRAQAAIQGKLQLCVQQTDTLRRRCQTQHPQKDIDRYRRQLDLQKERLALAVARLTEKKKLQLQAAAGKLESLNPAGVLARGWAIASKDGKTITDAATLQPGDKLLLRFARGGADCTVQQTWKGED